MPDSKTYASVFVFGGSRTRICD